MCCPEFWKGFHYSPYVVNKFKYHYKLLFFVWKKWQLDYIAIYCFVLDNTKRMFRVKNEVKLDDASFTILLYLSSITETKRNLWSFMLRRNTWYLRNMPPQQLESSISSDSLACCVCQQSWRGSSKATGSRNLAKCIFRNCLWRTHSCHKKNLLTLQPCGRNDAHSLNSLVSCQLS